MYCKNDVFYLEDEEIERLFTPPCEPIPISSKISPEDKLKRSFSLLESKMRQALKGDLDPAVYVMSADCGTGKTRTLQAVLREWKSNSFLGDGAIVMVATLAEMDAIIAGSGLSHEDYAVFTSDEKYKAYGAGRSAASRVPVLFVTHTMARKMALKAGSFEAVTEFHRDGRARALRVWDEKFDAAEGVAFDLADLYALPSAFKKLAKADLDLLWGLVRRCAEPVAGLKLDIPLSIVDVGDWVLKSGLKVGETPKRTLEALVTLAGSTAYLRGNEDAGWGFLGAGRSMPPDIAPLFVLDASARLTGSYRHLPAHGMKVVELEPALLTYEGVNVHWYNRGAGKSELRRPVERSIIFKAIADLVNSKPIEQFLIVMSKEACGGGGDAAATLPVELGGMITDPDRVRAATWGRHIGTNEYRNIPNVIIVSSHSYQSQSYDALAFAANGKRLELVNLDARREQEAEAFMHNVYQAVCRSSVRLRKGASSGDANVYLIMKDSDRRRGQVARAFPGCTVREWLPIPKDKEAKHDLVLRVLFSILTHKTSISLKDLGLACGGSGASYLTKVVKTDRFKEAISLKGIYRNGNRYYSKNVFSLAA